MPAEPRIAFFGTPAFAVPFLHAALAHARPLAVITQPDRRIGRHQELALPAVKQAALASGLEVWQPTSLRDHAWQQAFADLKLDLAIVVAYGRILPPEVLRAPRQGCVNAHASLLPRWRGASPIAAAIAAEDAETGVCLMQMDAGLDTGAVLAQVATPIAAQETTGDLTVRLAQLGADLLRAQLPALLLGQLRAQPQASAGVTVAPKLDKLAGRTLWQRSATALAAQVRAMQPWPGATTALQGHVLTIHRCHVVDAAAIASAEAGTVVRADAGGWHIACGTGALAIDEVQKAGRRRLSAADFLAGERRCGVGTVLGET